MLKDRMLSNNMASVEELKVRMLDTLKCDTIIEMVTVALEYEFSDSVSLVKKDGDYSVILKNVKHGHFCSFTKH